MVAGKCSVKTYNKVLLYQYCIIASCTGANSSRQLQCEEMVDGFLNAFCTNTSSVVIMSGIQYTPTITVTQTVTVSHGTTTPSCSQPTNCTFSTPTTVSATAGLLVDDGLCKPSTIVGSGGLDPIPVSVLGVLLGIFMLLLIASITGWVCIYCSRASRMHNR